MNIKILSPLWGHEHMSQQDFLDKIRLAGYDGFDMWVPGNPLLKNNSSII